MIFLVVYWLFSKKLFQEHCVILFDTTDLMYDSYEVPLLIQLNLINSKSSGLEVLFGMISSSNYREVDIKIYNSQK